MNTDYYTKRDELLNFIKDLKSIIQSIRTGNLDNKLKATLGNITYTTQSCIDYPDLLLDLLIEINEKIEDKEPSSITYLVSNLKQNSTSPIPSSQNPERILLRSKKKGIDIKSEIEKRKKLHPDAIEEAQYRANNLRLYLEDGNENENYLDKNNQG